MPRKKKPTYEQAMKKKKEEIMNMSKAEVLRETKYIIEFEDEGQDFLVWRIDKDGHVLDSQPFQRGIWGGKFTIPNFVQVGDLLPIWLDKETYIKYPIKKIEVRNIGGRSNG